MTLRDNITNMMDIAYRADKEFTKARNEFAEIVAKQQTEMTQQASQLSSTRIAPIVSTFNSDYIALFQDKFREIDRLLTQVIDTGAISEEAFASTSLHEIGIVNTNMRTEFYEIGLWWPTTELEWCVENVVNIRMNAEPPLDLSTLHPQTKYYSRSTATPTSPYKEISVDKVRELQEKYRGKPMPVGFGYYYVEPTKAPTIVTTLSRYTKPCLFEEWPDVYKNMACNDGLLFLKHTDGQFYPLYSNGYSGHRIFELHTGDDNGVSGKIWNDTSVTPVKEDIIYWQKSDPIKSGENFAIARVSNFKMIACTEVMAGSPTMLPKTVGPFYKCHANYGETLFDFTKLLRGEFGRSPSTGGLDRHVARRTSRSGDADAIDGMIAWFSREAAEYKSSSTILTKLTTPRALEQATSLYAAKYAVLKIMYGHIRRMTKGK